MRTQALTAFVALISTASSTYDWNGASPFSCPGNTDNHCSSSQSGGFSWTGLDLGSFSSYGGFGFDGWSCASSFGGSTKRDQLTGRNFQDKCITGSASSDVSSCPSFNCDSTPDVSAFSVDEFQISVEFDCTLEFHYGMPGGDICLQTSPCSKSGTTVKNTQCGGAKNVTVVYPGGGSSGGKSSCSIGVHSIGFDCSTASSKPTHSYTTPSVHTTSVPTTPTSSVATATSVPTYSVLASSSTPVETTSAEASHTTSIVYRNSTTVTPTIAITSGSPSTTVPLEVTSSPAVGSSTTPGTVLTTVVIETTTTVCPVTSTHTNRGTTSIETGSTTSTILITSTHTVCTKCEHTSTPAPISSPAGPSTTTTPSAPAETVPCPSILPQCLNTWMFSSSCGSNTDSSCYCTSSSFVCNVFDCLTAHGATDSEIASAQAYFQGICAPHASSNPAIITCASSVAPSTPVSSGTGAAGVHFTTPASIPVTTINILTTLTVPCSESGTAIPSSTVSVLSTILTVPQVIFQTITGSSTASAALVAGTAPPTSGSAGAVLSTPAGVPGAALSTPAGVAAATTIGTVAVPSSNGTYAPATPSSSQLLSANGSPRTTLTLSSLFGFAVLALFAM